MTGNVIRVARPERESPPPVAAVVESVDGASDIPCQLGALLHASGWLVEAVPQHRVSATERERWDVIVIPAKRITEDTLLLVARASRFPATRVALVSPDRDPHRIADTLRSGVDDYVVVPYQPQECLVRLAALANHARAIRARQRAGAAQPPTLIPAHVHLDHTTRSLRDGSSRVALSTREWAVLTVLLEAEEHMLSAHELAETVWGNASEAPRVISTISRLRRKLGASGVRALDIVTVRGLGYAARLNSC